MSIRIVLICSILSIHFLHTNGQQSAYYQINAKKGENYSLVFDRLEEMLACSISYSSELGTKLVADFIEIRSSDQKSFIEKLARDLHLEYTWAENNNLLIRSEKRITPKLKVEIFLKDAATGDPIAYTLVYTQDFTSTAYTDSTGKAELYIPKHNFPDTIWVNSLNYGKKILVLKKEAGRYNFALNIEPQPLDNIVIYAKKKQVEQVLQNLSFAALQSRAASNNIVFGNDPLRYAQMLSGISAMDDSRSSVRIRGGEEEATLLVMDDIPVYRTDHFLGIVSSVNGDYFQTWNVYKNYIPAHYGGKTSGMLEMKSDIPDSLFSGLVSSNLLYTSLNVESKPTDYFTVKLSARKSHPYVWNSGLQDFSSRTALGETRPGIPKVRNIISARPEFDFNDINGKINFSRDRLSVTLSTFLSSDTLSSAYDTRYMPRPFLVHREVSSQHQVWKNRCASLNTQLKFDSGLLSIQGYYTYHQDRKNVSSQLIRTGPGLLARDTLFLSLKNYIKDIGLKLNWQSKDSTWFAGFEGIAHDNFLFFEESAIPVFETTRQRHEYAGFAGYNLSILPQLLLRPSIRMTSLDLQSPVYVLPQIYAEFKWMGSNKIYLHAGRYAQFVRMIEFENFLGQRNAFFVMSNGGSIPVSVARGASIGYEYISGSFSTHIEGYQRKMQGALMYAKSIVSFRNGLPSISDYSLYKGEYRNSGLDVSATYQTIKWFATLQYSWSVSEQRYDQILNGQYFPSAQDSRHQLKSINGYRINNWDFNITYILATGRPYTDISLLDFPLSIEDAEFANFVRRLPDYQRIDASTAYSFFYKNIRCKTGVSVFNLLNRDNVRFRQFLFELPENTGSKGVLGTDIIQLGRTFNFHITFFI